MDSIVTDSRHTSDYRNFFCIGKVRNHITTGITNGICCPKGIKIIDDLSGLQKSAMQTKSMMISDN